MMQKGVLRRGELGVPENAKCCSYSHETPGAIKDTLKMHRADHFRGHTPWHMEMPKANDILVHYMAYG